MNEQRSQVHQAIQSAQEAVREAQVEPDNVEKPLRQAMDALQQAYQMAQSYADPNGLQQIQDAKNAIEQALRTAENREQTPIQSHNAIEQALRACGQIRSLTD